MITHTNFITVARETFREAKEHFAKPEWKGFHNLLTLEQLEENLRAQVKLTGGDFAILDETGQATAAQMEADFKDLLERYYLKLVMLFLPALDELHVLSLDDHNNYEDTLSCLRIAFKRCGAAQKEINVAEFEAQITRTAARFEKENAALGPERLGLRPV